MRFAATEPPPSNRSGVQDGSYGKICPNAFASWQIGASSLNPGAENENEDCLFLDVVVPRYVYDNKTGKDPSPVIVWFHGGAFTLGSKYSAGNPVGLLDQSLDTGSKGQIWVGESAFRSITSPSVKSQGRFRDLSVLITHIRVMLTAMFWYKGVNYRLGALGWLNGPDFVAQGGIPNAGLYDQRMALRWLVF